ncbi:MAG: GNAT family N-acetyltransferase [Erythrobacter sp.]
MDVAAKPAILRPTPSTAREGSGRQAVRLLSPSEAAAPAFVASWEALAANAAEPNPFFEPWFMLPSFEQFAGDDQARLFAHFAGGQLVGVLPLAQPPRYYGHAVPHLASWLHDNAFCGAPLVAKGNERGFWRALLAQADSRSRRAMFLHLSDLPAEGPLNVAIDAVLAEGGRRAVTVEKGERAMLASSLDPQDYLEQSMSAKKRKELRRQHKRLAEEGKLTVERSEGAEGIAGWIAEFLALESAGWKGEEGSALASSASTRAFFKDTLTRAAKAGRLERLALRLDGKAIAMLANFVSPPGVFSFKTTFDETYSRFSPGLLLQIENLQLLARQDVEWADSCAAEGHPMIERIWREKRTIVSRNIAIGGPLRRAAFRALMVYETRGRSAP